MLLKHVVCRDVLEQNGGMQAFKAMQPEEASDIIDAMKHARVVQPPTVRQAKVLSKFGKTAASFGEASSLLSQLLA